jgi:3-oxoacyl-[acyl-carrier protein] reductase
MNGPLSCVGRTVLVVGGSSGIGNGIARAFLNAGAEVHVWGTRAAATDYDASEGSDLSGLHYGRMDAADREAVARYEASFDRLDVLVLSQGTVVYKRGEFEPDGWDHVMAVNLDSILTCATRFKGMLARAKGSLLVVSSISGFQANIGNPAYSASKAGAISLTRTLAKAWAREGIRVNGIAPGLVDTKLTQVTLTDAKRRDASLNAIPAGRIGRPGDMGDAALFLASPLASYVCGHVLVVDGGLSLV